MLPGFGMFFSLDKFDKVNVMFRLLMILLISENSADFEGWIKLIKRKEKNITFFEIPENDFKV